jgi:fatty acid desaturase
MSPREERRFRLVWLVGLPFAVLVGVVSSTNDWSVGWITLVVIVFLALAAVFVHR